MITSARPRDHRTSGNASGSAVRNRDVNRDHPTIDHRERLWDRRSEIAADPFRILYQKIMRFVAAALIWNLARSNLYVD